MSVGVEVMSGVVIGGVSGVERKGGGCDLGSKKVDCCDI